MSSRRALRALSTVLVATGALMLADAVLTVLWQEPVTALMAHRRQDDLAADLHALEAAGPTAIELEALSQLRSDRRRVAFLARSLKRRAADGDAIARLRIPRIGADDIVVEGTNPDDLRHGPGSYDDAPLPGAPGTAAIAGHRTTYGAPFRHIDELRAGDEITLELPYATFTYRVQGSKIVRPSDLAVLRRTGYDRLVLSACHPLFSAAKRIVVFARLARTVPS